MQPRKRWNFLSLGDISFSQINFAAVKLGILRFLAKNLSPVVNYNSIRFLKYGQKISVSKCTRLFVFLLTRVL